MLISIVGQFQEEGERDVDRYSLWESAIRQLRSDGENGTHPEPRQLPGYLENLPEEQRSDALQDLVAEHLRLTWKRGEGTLLETYLAEFAGNFREWASPETVPADLVEDEFLARYQLPLGDTPALDEYRKRFPSRADVMKALEQHFFDGGRFVKLHKRGSGAMGEVWEVFDTQSRECVALKEPRGGAEILRQFADEAAVTADLEHAGIVHLRERQHSDGTRFYTMRLVDGETLTDCIGSYHQPPSERTSREQTAFYRELQETFASICEVVACAHAGGVLHRDLKPGNVIVEASGDAAILDWGMARRIAADGSPSVSTGEKKIGSNVTLVAGTPESMPPEQVDGISDTRSDVFGLGAILYEILTGGSPHDWAGGARPADWKGIVRQAAFPGPRRVNVQTPRALDAICMKALARDPGDRYQSADELARDVRGYLKGRSVWVRIWRRVRGWTKS